MSKAEDDASFIPEYPDCRPLLDSELGLLVSNRNVVSHVRLSIANGTTGLVASAGLTHKRIMQQLGAITNSELQRTILVLDLAEPKTAPRVGTEIDTSSLRMCIRDSVVMDSVIYSNAEIRSSDVEAAVVYPGSVILRSSVKGCPSPMVAAGLKFEMFKRHPLSNGLGSTYCSFLNEFAPIKLILDYRRSFEWYCRAVEDALYKATKGTGAYGEGTASRDVVCQLNDGFTCRIGGNCKIESSRILDSILTEHVSASWSSLRESVCHTGVSVCGSSNVSNSVVFSSTHVEEGCVIKHSIIGPSCSFGRGEVTASLIGPLANMHHTGLLIACYWPKGKGNVGAGALIGSNHTSRAPNQFARIGEGVFFGLGSKAKFPLNISNAHYSVIAADVCIPSQKIDFPFSLITRGTNGNEVDIVPGWVLGKNILMLFRNELKFKKRAQRQEGEPNFRIDSDEILSSIMNALNCLTQRSQDSKSLSEETIKNAMQWYSEFLTFASVRRWLSRKGESSFSTYDRVFFNGGWVNPTVDTNEAILSAYTSLIIEYKWRAQNCMSRDITRECAVFDDRAREDVQRGVLDAFHDVVEYIESHTLNPPI